MYFHHTTRLEGVGELEDGQVESALALHTHGGPPVHCCYAQYYVVLQYQRVKRFFTSGKIRADRHRSLSESGRVYRCRTTRRFRLLDMLLCSLPRFAVCYAWRRNQGTLYHGICWGTLCVLGHSAGWGENK